MKKGGNSLFLGEMRVSGRRHTSVFAPAVKMGCRKGLFLVMGRSEEKISISAIASAPRSIYYKNHFVIYIKTSVRLVPHTRLL